MTDGEAKTPVPGEAADLSLSERLWDLLRYCRSELFVAGLITDDEYAALAEDTKAVARLGTYDELKAQLKTITEERDRLHESLAMAIQRIRDGLEKIEELRVELERLRVVTDPIVMEWDSPKQRGKE